MRSHLDLQVPVALAVHARAHLLVAETRLSTALTQIHPLVRTGPDLEEVLDYGTVEVDLIPPVPRSRNVRDEEPARTFPDHVAIRIRLDHRGTRRRTPSAVSRTFRDVPGRKFQRLCVDPSDVGILIG